MNDRKAPSKTTIGGTAAVAILGKSRYKSRYDKWIELCDAIDGKYEPEPPTEPMIRGSVCEDPLVTHFYEQIVEQTGLSPGVLFGDGKVNHPDFPFLHATPDRLLYDKKNVLRGVLEVKTYDTIGGDFDWEREDYAYQQAHYHRVVSDKYGAELKQNYLMVCSASHFVWKDLTSLVQRYQSGEYPTAGIGWAINDLIRRKIRFEIRPAKTVDYNEKFDELIHFWGHCIEERNPPPVDEGSLCEAKFSEYENRERFIDESVEDQEGKDAFNDLSGLTEEYFRLKDLVSRYDKEFKAIKNKMRSVCSGAQIKKAAVPNATVSFQTRKTGGRTDTAALEKDHPDLIKDYRKPEGKMLVLSVRRRQSEVKK